MNAALERLGIQTEQLQAARAHGEWSPVDANEFFDRAGALLDILPDIVMDAVVPDLEQHNGRWHPSGFMVYPLGTHAELGSLRLHIWPQGLRQHTERGHGLMYSQKLGLVYDADIHNHAWNIVSHNYTGYSDDLFGLSPICHPIHDYAKSDGKHSNLDIYRVHRVTYVPDSRVSLVPHTIDEYNYGKTLPGARHGWVIAHVKEHRDIPDDDLHLIEAGEFHAPNIPFGRLAVTLAFNSHRVAEGPDVLIRGQLSETSYQRQEVTPEEALLAKGQLLAMPTAAGRLATAPVVQATAPIRT